MERITLETFQQKVMENEKPVLLEFTGSFCPGCVRMEPVLNELQSEYVEKVDFLEVNADQEELLNTLLHVYSLPATFLFKKGKAVKAHSGFWAYSDLRSEIAAVIHS